MILDIMTNIAQGILLFDAVVLSTVVSYHIIRGKF